MNNQVGNETVYELTSGEYLTITITDIRVLQDYIINKKIQNVVLENILKLNKYLRVTKTYLSMDTKAEFKKTKDIKIKGIYHIEPVFKEILPFRYNIIENIDSLKLMTDRQEKETDLFFIN